jgi:hypothetical protein
MTEQAFEHNYEISLLDTLVTLAELWKLYFFIRKAWGSAQTYVDSAAGGEPVKQFWGISGA